MNKMAPLVHGQAWASLSLSLAACLPACQLACLLACWWLPNLAHMQLGTRITPGGSPSLAVYALPAVFHNL